LKNSFENRKGVKDNQIVSRRYFYPSLNTINYANGQPMPISNIAASVQFTFVYLV
jgi:hypothetical protein